jgi:hypothetical protein
MRTVQLTLAQRSDTTRTGVWVNFYIEPEPKEYKHLYVNKNNIESLSYMNNGLISLSIQQQHLKSKSKMRLAVSLTESPVTNFEMQKEK